MEEIEERLDFLDGMKKFGVSQNYDQGIRQEIAKKFKELKVNKKWPTAPIIFSLAFHEC